LRSLKQTLQENLSLSSKLFLRGLFAASRRIATGIVGRERAPLPKGLKQVREANNRKRDWPRIVVFDERVPSPDRDAGSLRMFLILKTLAEWCQVVFVPFNRPQSADYETALWKAGIETADAVEYRRLLRDKNVAAAIISRPSMAGTFIHRIRRTNPRV